MTYFPACSLVLAASLAMMKRWGLAAGHRAAALTDQRGVDDHGTREGTTRPLTMPLTRHLDVDSGSWAAMPVVTGRARQPGGLIACGHDGALQAVAQLRCGYPAALAFFTERMTGIEPASRAWEALILPLNYIRSGGQLT